MTSARRVIEVEIPITCLWYDLYELVDGNAAVDEDADDAARTLQGFSDDFCGSSSSVAEAVAACDPSSGVADAELLAVDSLCPLA